MDILDLIINFFNVTGSSSLLKKNFTTFNDKEEYLGERIKSFFLLVILMICYVLTLICLIYLIAYLLSNKKQ
jgi:hypothetical protein